MEIIPCLFSEGSFSAACKNITTTGNVFVFTDLLKTSLDLWERGIEPDWCN